VKRLNWTTFCENIFQIRSKQGLKRAKERKSNGPEITKMGATNLWCCLSAFVTRHQSYSPRFQECIKPVKEQVDFTESKIETPIWDSPVSQNPLLMNYSKEKTQLRDTFTGLNRPPGSLAGSKEQECSGLKVLCQP
jgi:hypothetical protein